MGNKNSIKKIVGSKNFTLVIVWFAVMVLFQLLNKNFVSVHNIQNIFNQTFVMGTIAVGMSCLLISGQIDLSAGAIGMFAGVIVANLLQLNVPWVLAILLTLAFGALIGLINAFFTNTLNFVAFISTLGMSSVLIGLALVWTDAQNVAIVNASFNKLGSVNLFGIIPMPYFITVLLLAVYGFILSSTRFGRRVYMSGGNAQAARLAGINPKRITTVLFVNNGVLSSLSGILLASKMQTASSSGVLGTDLEAITAAVLGGISFVGGSGGMVGVFIGLMLLNSFKNGLVVVGLNPYYQLVASGLLLIAALTLDFFREKARLRALKASDSALSQAKVNG